MILFVSKRRHLAELRRAQLRENVLKNEIEDAMRKLLQARHATHPVRDFVEPARKQLQLALIQVSSIR